MSQRRNMCIHLCTCAGIFTNGSNLTLYLFYNTTGGKLNMASPRVYLLANDSTYGTFSLLDREFTFDVTSASCPAVPMGPSNSFSNMEAKGGQSDLNPAGAGYGTGYCDAQCPTPPFINGEVLTVQPILCNDSNVYNLPRQISTRMAPAAPRLLRGDGHLGSQLQRSRFHPTPLQRHWSLQMHRSPLRKAQQV